MESLNLVQLRGVVGSVHLTEGGGKTVARLSLATNLVFRDSGGCPVIETTWHDVVIWESESIPADNLRSLSKGDKLFIKGRIRTQRYTAADGTERSSNVIVATEIERLDLGTQNLQLEMVQS